MRKQNYKSKKRQNSAATAEYKAVERMLYKLSHSFHNTTGIELNELLSEATVLYYESKKTFDPEKGMKFTSWAYRIIYNGLCDFCRREKIHRIYDEQVEQGRTEKPFWELQEQLSENAKQVVDYLLNNAIDLTPPPRLVRGDLTRFLREKGWKFQEIWDTMRELKAIEY